MSSKPKYLTGKNYPQTKQDYIEQVLEMHGIDAELEETVTAQGHLSVKGAKQLFEAVKGGRQ